MAIERTHNLHNQLAKRKELRHNTTPEENAIWHILKGKSLGGYKWRRQFSVGPYIMDFYCPSAKLCIEVDGIHHNSEEQMEYDNKRSEFLAKQGIRVLRIPNKIVWGQSNLIANAILNEIINSSPKLGEVPKGRRGMP